MVLPWTNAQSNNKRKFWVPHNRRTIKVYNWKSKFTRSILNQAIVHNSAVFEYTENTVDSFGTLYCTHWKTKHLASRYFRFSFDGKQFNQFLEQNSLDSKDICVKKRGYVLWFSKLNKTWKKKIGFESFYFKTIARKEHFKNYQMLY